MIKIKTKKLVINLKEIPEIKNKKHFCFIIVEYIPAEWQVSCNESKTCTSPRAT